MNHLSKDQLIRLHGELFQHAACPKHGTKGMVICSRCTAILCSLDEGARCGCADVSESAIKGLLRECLSYIMYAPLRDKIVAALRIPEDARQA